MPDTKQAGALMHAKGDTLKPDHTTDHRREQCVRSVPASAGAKRGGAPSGSSEPRSDGPSPAGLDFDHVYDTHFDFVWRSLRLLGIPDELVEDAIQDTFSIVSHKLASFEGRSALRTWLFAILYRVASNYRRTRRRKSAPLVPLEDMAGNEPGPEAYAEARDVARIVERYCAGLEPGRRALFVLAVLEELPPADVASSLGMPVPLVYSRVFTLRKGLEQALRAREVEGG